MLLSSRILVGCCSCRVKTQWDEVTAFPKVTYLDDRGFILEDGDDDRSGCVTGASSASGISAAFARV